MKAKQKRGGSSTTRPAASVQVRPSKVRSTLDADRLRLELDVHQEELATQNEELRRANAALLAAKERYAELYDGAPIAYFTLDEGGTIVEVNLAGAELLGASRNFLFGRRFDEIVVPSARESFRGFRQRVLDHGGRPIHETVLATVARRFPARIEASRLAGAAFPADQCLLCVIDETEHRRIEEERRRLEARVAEAHRVESLGMLAGGIARDFNDILAVALAHADLLLLDASESSRTRQSVLDIKDAVTRAAHLSDQMLAYSGHGRLHTTEPLDVSKIVRSMSGLLATAAPKDALILDLADDLPLVSGESVRLRQIVLNLVVNAAEAISPALGRIVLRTTRESCVDGDTAQSPGRIVIEVSDDGPGMDEATRQRAFDPFFSTKLAGRGLGLAVVHGNARSHGGTVTVESRPHGGTTFRVYLPTSPSAAKSPASDLSVDAPWRGSGVVLVVDDVKEVRDVMGRVLRRLGFEVCYAEDGLDALEVARQSPSPLVSVMLDLMMPRLDGRATLAQLKRLNPSLPVILTSGFSGDALDDALMATADGFVSKPFTTATVKLAMQRALAGSS